MKEDNLPLARWCLERADKMDVEYDGLFQRFVDTPDKLRRDLEKLEHGSPSPMAGDTDDRSNLPAIPDLPTRSAAAGSFSARSPVSLNGRDSSVRPTHP